MSVEGLDMIDVLSKLSHELKNLLDNDPKIYDEYELRLGLHYTDQIKKYLKTMQLVK